MGVLNVTPDSFSDGGAFLKRDAAVARALRMVAEGADIIDVGGESTRPGAAQVPCAEELARVIPVIEMLATRTNAALSVDTTKAEVARAAIDAGAIIVNDVSALRLDPQMADVVAQTGAGVVLMHMQGEPRTMQTHPAYVDVVEDIKAELGHWASRAQEAGIAPVQIAVDPGIGFGKTREHNLTLIREIGRFGELGFAVMVGASRKAFIGSTLDLPVEDRLEGTAAVVAWVVAKGAHIVRVHDVKAMTRVVRMTEAIRKS